MFSLLIASVLGHATINPPVASSAYAVVAVRVPHGCDTSPTIEVTVDIPVGIGSVKPRRASGWRLRTETRPLNTPITTEGGTVINTEISKVIWYEGNLPDNEYEEFSLSMRLPLPVAEGHRFFIPVSQRCIQGSVNWTEIPSGTERPRYPAPALTFFSNGTMTKFNSTWVQAQMKTSSANGIDWTMATMIGLLAASVL
jgi:periplasmic copper chaperone A